MNKLQYVIFVHHDRVTGKIMGIDKMLSDTQRGYNPFLIPIILSDEHGFSYGKVPQRRFKRCNFYVRVLPI